MRLRRAIKYELPVVALPFEVQVTMLLAELESKGGHREIAAFLTSQGALGARNTEAECPVSVWLSRRLQRPLLALMVNAVSVLAVPRGDPQAVTMEPMPPNVEMFLLLFDRGEYPELVGKCNTDG